jgi:hypothetical protein
VSQPTGLLDDSLASSSLVNIQSQTVDNTSIQQFDDLQSMLLPAPQGSPVTRAPIVQSPLHRSLDPDLLTCPQRFDDGINFLDLDSFNSSDNGLFLGGHPPLGDMNRDFVDGDASRSDSSGNPLPVYYATYMTTNSIQPIALNKAAQSVHSLGGVPILGGVPSLSGVSSLSAESPVYTPDPSHPLPMLSTPLTEQSTIGKNLVRRSMRSTVPTEKVLQSRGPVHKIGKENISALASKTKGQEVEHDAPSDAASKNGKGRYTRKRQGRGGGRARAQKRQRTDV